MPFPDLVRNPGGALHATAIGVPSNGVNTFKLPLDPDLVNPDWLDITVVSLGPSVTGAAFVSYDEDTRDLSVSFVQGGTDQARVFATVVQSSVR